MCHLTAPQNKEPDLYVVWERSSSSMPFFEAGTADAIRVWSVETSTEHVEDVGLYVVSLSMHVSPLAASTHALACGP